ncbi:MAG: hypothetical protein R3230_00250 [Nitrosopumilaceae archaeon]|nr:hypothetical protein [Nitrosopumilaceae archaeon]
MACTCCECGRKYRIDIMVSDVMWNDIKPDPEDGELLCGPCIMTKMEHVMQDIDAYLYFHLKQ